MEDGDKLLTGGAAPAAAFAVSIEIGEQNMLSADEVSHLTYALYCITIITINLSQNEVLSCG